jgi:hypothetical protein
MSRYSIPVKEETRDRLRAYSNRNLINRQTYDEAVNDLLDEVEFASAEELNTRYGALDRGRA